LPRRFEVTCFFSEQKDCQIDPILVRSGYRTQKRNSMKTLLTLAAIFCFYTINIHADTGGVVAFLNSASSLITLPDGSPAPVGTELELFYQPGGPIAPTPILCGGIGAWEVTAGLGQNPFALNFANGRFNAGNENTGSDVPAGGNAWFTVVGWDGRFASYQLAIERGGDVGESSIFELTTGGGGTPPQPPTLLPASTPGQGFVGGTPFAGVILGAPEPSIIALSGLGGAVLVLFRRKK
jgi:hypothetical protein